MVYFDNISATKLELLEQCPFKYFQKYIKKLPLIFNPNSSETAMQFGSFIHRVLERGVKCTTLKELKQLTIEERKNYKFEGYSHETIMKCLTNFLEFNKTLTGETIGVEFSFEVEFADGIKATGIIDRVVQNENGTLLLIDYKTSKRPKTSGELMRNDQAQLYVSVASKLFDTPINKILFIHYYPHLNKIVPVKFFDGIITNFKNKTIKRVWDTRKKKEVDFKPRINNFCSTCEYQPICPAWKTPAEILETMQKYGPAIEKYKALQAKRKEDEAKKKQ